MMSKEELKPVMFAWLNGQPVEFRVLSNPRQPWSLSVGDCPDFFNSELLWRIKPEKKLRPWKPEEVPVGAVVKDIRDGSIIMSIVCSFRNGMRFQDNTKDGSQQSFVSARDSYLWKWPQESNWHPCGVEE